MDVLITKKEINLTFSSLGLLVNEFEDSSPSLSLNRMEINYRKGYIFSGAVHKDKNITVSGTFVVPSAGALEAKKDELNGLISDDKPFYLTKMIPTEDIYEFELPGERSDDLDYLSIPHEMYKYRYKVIVENPITYEFLGYSKAGLRMRFTIDCKTAELPYGETIPKNIDVVDSISYGGTAECSQLEWPWAVKMTATKDQANEIYLTVGDRTFAYQSETPISREDVLVITGIETTLNGINVNDKTNYEHFILTPSANKIIKLTTNFIGKIQLTNFVELYR